MLDRLLRSDTRWATTAFALLAVAGYAAALLPILAANRWDVSFLAQAGSLFVNGAQTGTHVKVLAHSAGYDGQFYLRMALAPFSFRPIDHGIRFDAPSYRSQRFLYPLLAWVLALGRPGAMPGALLAVNLLGIGAIAAASLRLTRALQVTPAAALAIVLWSGFLVALTHDTSEIVAQAFLLAALLCRVRGRLGAYVLLGAAATVTRETTALVFVGVLLGDAWLAWRARESVARVMCGALLLAPVVGWHVSLPHLWHERAPEGVLSHDFDWPFAGFASVLADRIAAVADGGGSIHTAVGRSVNLVATFGLAGFCCLVAVRLRGAMRRGGDAVAIATGWLPVAMLMSLLRAGDGPWVTPTEYGRAFSECWVVGCLVLGLNGAPGEGRRLAVFGLLAAGLELMHTRGSFGLHVF